MKFFNRINKKQAFASLLLIGAISFGIVSCNDSDNDVSPDGVEAESAYLQVYSNDTPTGSITYMRASENIPSNIDLSQSVELGQNTTVIPFGKNAYAINSTASTITKWIFDESNLKPNVDGLLSFASAGLSTSRTIVFASETQAFLADFLEGSILEFNPDIMEVVKIHEVPSLPAGGTYQFGTSESYYVEAFPGQVLSSGKVVWSLYYFDDQICCNSTIPENAPALAVFDPSTDLFTYKIDDRFPMGCATQPDADGNVYITPNINLIESQHYYQLDLEPKLFVSKLDENGDFDESFTYDLSAAVANIKSGGEIAAVDGNRLLVNYTEFTEAWPDSFDDRFLYFTSENKKVSIIDTETDEVTSYSGLDQYTFGTFLVSVSDGVNYHNGFSFNDGVFQAVFLEQQSFTEFTVLTSGDPGTYLTSFGRLW